ncbi:PREDICTED: folliculin [Papilio polytes]|uniref:folliculin n=1 Tax=Papilio polytes TaxID=76194 RepID=UPI000675BF49|nr:PREDICTED: folliculin [Papilio polytes]
MNAIIGLCHFCEAHGPRPLFCTFTTDDENHTTESSKSSVQCSGCTSLGPETVLVSREDDGTIYCSRESVPNAGVNTFLRQAAVRSITCEVSWSKEGGVVYFSETQGHVLSLMFQVKDTRARGLKRWFSIVVLMKDKMLLLNLTPMLSEHMQKISKELQHLTDEVYEKEQSICSQRALRLKTGRNDFGQSRSLIQLTGDENVYKRLHSHFTWMLKTGALTYSETLYTSKDLLDKICPKTMKTTIFEQDICLSNYDGEVPIRSLENLLSKSIFRILLYCILTGIDVIVSSNITEAANIIKGLLLFCPVPSDAQCRISNEDINVATSKCCILGKRENFECKWSGILPEKCPTLMNRIEAAIDNQMFKDPTLHHHIKSLLLEWLGIANTLKSAISSSGRKSDAIVKLKQILGVMPHDEVLLNYWMNTFCS